MDFNRYSTTYSEKLDESIAYCPLSHDFFTRVKADHLRALVDAAHGSDAQPELLDLGCGGGLTDSLLKARFQKLQGMDVSEGLVEEARRRNPEVPYRTYDGRRSDFPDGSFDVVFAICVWHHVPPADWPGFAAECFRLLRPGGRMLVYEHNPFNPLTRLSVAKCEFDEDAVLLSARKARSLLRGAGFERFSTEYLLFLPLDQAWCRAIEKAALRKIPFGAQYMVCAQR